MKQEVKKDKVNIAVLVSGGGTNLQALIDSDVIKSGVIRLVISSNESAYALKRAENAGIKAETVDKTTYKSLEQREKRMLELLRENDIELIVLAGFLSILSKDFISHYEKRIINVHPSLIPAFCGKGYYGLTVHERVLEKGVKITGATTHFVNEIADDGEIIMQRAVRVYKNDTEEKLQLRVMKQAEHIILPKSVELVSKQLLGERDEA